MGHRRTPQADFDLDDIWHYVAGQSGSTDTADRVVDTITDRFSFLAANPNVGRVRNADLRPGIRSFPVGQYIVLYLIDEGDVLILRVMHGRRDLSNLLLQ